MKEKIVVQKLRMFERTNNVPVPKDVKWFVYINGNNGEYLKFTTYDKKQ